MLLGPVLAVAQLGAERWSAEGFTAVAAFQLVMSQYWDCCAGSVAGAAVFMQFLSARCSQKFALLLSNSVVSCASLSSLGLGGGIPGSM